MNPWANSPMLWLSEDGCNPITFLIKEKEVSPTILWGSQDKNKCADHCRGQEVSALPPHWPSIHTSQFWKNPFWQSRWSKPTTICVQVSVCSNLIMDFALISIWCNVLQHWCAPLWRRETKQTPHWAETCFNWETTSWLRYKGEGMVVPDMAIAGCSWSVTTCLLTNQC